MIEHELFEKNKVNNANEIIGYEALILADLIAHNAITENMYMDSLKRVKQGEYSIKEQQKRMTRELFDLFEPCYKHSEILKRLVIKFRDTPCNKDIVARDIVRHTKLLVNYINHFDSLFPRFPSTHYWEKDEALMSFLSFIDISCIKDYSFTYDDLFDSIKYKKEIFDDFLCDIMNIIENYYNYSQYNIEGKNLDLIYQLQNITRYYGSDIFWHQLYEDENIKQNKDVYILALNHAKELKFDDFSKYLYKFVYERCGYNSFIMKKIVSCFASKVNDFSHKLSNKQKIRKETFSQMRLLTINQTSENIKKYLELLNEDFMQYVINNNNIFYVTAINITTLDEVNSILVNDKYEEIKLINNNPLIIIWQTSDKDYYFLDQKTEYRCHVVMGDITNELPKRKETLINVSKDIPLFRIISKVKRELEKPYVVDREVFTTKGFKAVALNNSIDVLFTDGYIGHATPKQFEDSKVEHPLITTKGKTITYQKPGVKERLIGTRCGLHNNKVYYKCNCEKCNWDHKKVLSAQQFLQHGKECI